MTLSALITHINDAFSKEEMKLLCVDVGLNHEDLPDDSKSEMALELVMQAKRRGMLSALVERCRAVRPHKTWEVPQEPPVPQPPVVPGNPFNQPTPPNQPINPIQDPNAMQQMSDYLSGRWQITCVGDNIYMVHLELALNGALQATGRSVMYPSFTIQGQCFINPAMNSFQISGVTSSMVGSAPLNFYHFIQSSGPQGFTTRGSDNLTYVFTRMQ